MKLDKTGNKISKSEKILGVLTVLLVVVFVLPSPTFITTNLLHLGFISHHDSSRGKLIQLGKELVASPARFMASQSEMPLLKIDISYPDWQIIVGDRRDAFEKGVIAENRHMVNGVVNFEGKAYKTKLRLQGDALEHIVGARRWSLRFDLKNNKSILKNKRFALLSSNVRIHQGPYLFSETLKKAGFDIISPQMNPVKVVINGVNWGVMLMEETFGQDLLKSNHRTQGIVARLDILQETKDIEGQITRKFQARAIQRTSILKDPELNKHRRMALSLISEFFEGKRKASEVFDHEKLGQYLATIDVWSAWHALSWNNWRWYYNPDTSKLEPIQSDVAVTPAKHYWLTQAVTKEFPVALKMLSDTKVKSSYDTSLARLLNLLDQGEMQAHLSLKQAGRVRKLHYGMPLINDFDFAIMHQQTRCLYSGYLQEECQTIPKLDSSLHLHLTNFDAAKNWDLASTYTSSLKVGGENRLRIKNTSLESLKLHSIEGLNKLNLMDELEEVNYALPLEIKPNEEAVLNIPVGISNLTLYAAVKSKKIAPFYFYRDQDPLALLTKPSSQGQRSKQNNLEINKIRLETKSGLVKR